MATDPQDSDYGRIPQLTDELLAKAASLQSEQNLESILPLVGRIKAAVDGKVNKLKTAFASDEWPALPKNRGKSDEPSDAIGLNAIHDVTSRIRSRLEKNLRNSQLLYIQLEALEEALEDFIPVYKLELELDIFSHQDTPEMVIKDACDGIGRLLQDSDGVGEEC
jgi:hypothetical protein